MIKSYKQLTGRYLKENKKRTILSLIGIILSVALISSIGLFIRGMQAVQLQNAKNHYGSYDLMFTNINDDFISKIVNNPELLRYGFLSSESAIKLQNMTATVVDASGDALKLFPAYVKQGRLPQNQNEAVVEEWALQYIKKDAKIGDKFKFNNKEYLLTGILENSIENQSDNKIIIAVQNNNILKEKSILLVEINPGANVRMAIKQLKQTAYNAGVKASENTMLHAIEGIGDNSSQTSGIYTVLAVIIGIVVVATVAVIYNAFQISVVERIKQFGLLRGIGATPGQIRKIVLREASVLAAIGVPVGLICGIIAMSGISTVFNMLGSDSIFAARLVIDPKVLLLSAAVGVISVYISALIPSINAGRISPILAISSRNAITKEKIKRRNTHITQKLFGFEGAMAFKNIKRNRKRYRITVFSIAISVVLFVTFKSFMDMSLTISNIPNESRNIHFSILQNGQNRQKLDEEYVENIKNINVVDKVYKVYQIIDFHAAIDRSSEIKKVESIGNIYNSSIINGSEKTILFAGVAIYDSDSLNAARKYLISGNIDQTAMDRENGVILINKNTIINYKTKKKYVGPAANLKVGDEIDLRPSQYDSSGNAAHDFDMGETQKVKVLGIVSDDPFDFNGSESGLKLITTKEVADKITAESNIEFSGINIRLKDPKYEEAAKQSIKSTIMSDPSLTLIDNIDENRRSKSVMLMAEILLYGFVIVVSLISCINIINTLTTNIILRKREFAALKSIGLTQRGLKKMIVLEGLLYGLAGGVYGSIAGCALSFIMYSGFGRLREFAWNVPYKTIIIAVAASLIIGYISILSPLSRIKKENLIEVIREE